MTGKNDDRCVVIIGSSPAQVAHVDVRAKLSVVPPQYTPMAPTLVREPFHRSGWIYEEKVDGWRILAYKDGGRVRLVSRKGITHDGRFRELAQAVARLTPTTLVLDGEVAIFDQQLRSRFDLLRHRDPDVIATPPMLIAFDVMYRNGEDLTALPLRDRRKLLEDAIDGADMVLPARRLGPDGLEAWADVLDRGYEGMVGKDEASPYRGGATRSWLKVKVPGWTDSEDRWHRVRLSANSRELNRTTRRPVRQAPKGDCRDAACDVVQRPV